MDRKPIFVIYLEQPMLRQHMVPIFEKIGKDYHVLVLPGKENRCEMFNGEKIEPIELEELKKELSLAL